MKRKCLDCKEDISSRHFNTVRCKICAATRANKLVRKTRRMQAKELRMRLGPLICAVAHCNTLIPRLIGKGKQSSLCRVCQTKKDKLIIKYGVRKWAHRALGIIDAPSREAYDRLVKVAKKRKYCQCCGRKNKGRWVLHHDHKSGRSIGIICNRCNIGFGFFDDDLKLMKKAYKWVKYHKVWNVR